MEGKASNILELIGRTPMVRLNRLNPNPRVKIYVKLEYFNPGGSVKDRPALAMIEAAEAAGELTPDKTVLEATSGNTGIGLALVCAVKGYRLLLAMPESASMERKKILKAMGAELLLTPAHQGTDGSIEEVYRLTRENPAKYFLADQFNNPDNPAAHRVHRPGDLGADRRPGHHAGGHPGHQRHGHGPVPLSEGVQSRHPGGGGGALPGPRHPGPEKYEGVL